MDDREAFLARRAEGLGASDSPAILGLSPWAGPLSVWMDKVGQAPADSPSLPMWLGLQLQRTVGELFVTRTGKKVRASHVQSKHPVFSYIRCHLDFTVVGESAVLETKTARSTDGWGDEGSDKVPPYYWVQVQHQLAVTGRETGYIGCLFGHYEFRYFVIPRDEDFIRKLTAALVEFWEMYVVPQVQPPLDGSEDATRLLKRKYPTDLEPAFPATPEQSAFVERLVKLRKLKAKLELKDVELTNQVKDLIGTRAGMFGGTWHIIWRKQKPRVEVKWKEVAQDVRPFVPEGEWDGAVSTHTEEKDGGRPFLLKYDKDTEDKSE